MKPLRSGLFRNTLWMLWGFGVRLGLQLLYFILVARALGADGYGAFIGVVAIVSVLAPFSSWGSGNILIKNASRNPERFGTYWGAALAVTLLSGGLLAGVSFTVTGVIFSREAALTLALPIALGDLIGIRLADVSGQAFQSREKLSWTSSIWVLMSALRLLGAATLFWLPIAKTPSTWALIYGLTGLLAGVAGVLWVRRELGTGPLSIAPMRREWREGFFFSISLAAQGSYNDIDKTLLARLVSQEVAGGYAAAYRVLDAAFAPMRALLYASYPRFFREGGKGIHAAKAFSFRLLPWGVGMGVIGGLFVVAVAPILPVFLGGEYTLSIHVLPLLAPILLFRVLHYLAADSLTGAGYQWLRSAAQVGVAILNLGLNLLWIPLWGWRGAVWSSLVSDGLLALGLWAMLVLLTQKERLRS